MPFSIKSADADQYRIALTGVPLTNGPGQSGLADGEFFTAAQPTRSFVFKEGTDGSVTRNKTNSRILEMHYKCMVSSAQNAFLSSLLAADENAPNGAGIGTFICQDQQGTTLILCSAAWIDGPPEVHLDRDPQERDWTIIGIRDVFIAGGN